MEKMLDKCERDAISALIRREVVPATGCTEPVAVALCAAYAARLLPEEEEPREVKALLSANILKNAMGVGIPGTGMTGLPIAIALGTLFGNPEKQLEVLGGLDDLDIRRGRDFMEHVDIKLKDNPDDKLPILYIEVEVTGSNGSKGVAVIADGHTNLVYTALNGNASLDRRHTMTCPDATVNTSSTDPKLTMEMVWNYAIHTPVDELRFILESRRMNKAVAEESFIGHYGHCMGRTLHSARQEAMMGNSIFCRILSYTSAAADARMAGASIPVMSNSGSGNQGIAATLPVAVFAEEIFADEEQTIRALALSHLMVIYIKQSLGRLSALCGCVVAATGSGCGICYLMGGGYDQVVATAKNMVANLTGMICDGAKASCALKVTSGVSTAMMSAMLAMEGHCVTSAEGIIDDDIDRTIANLTRIGRFGMRETDKLILEIMTTKHH